eukprot:TRINITY_DN48904_c0_g1_i1.p1 TRINITY_DN48904_c0_g1~~TRINITY_DN48904_c0_g1_i1.p1  ORF type:complete len:629 (+),score=112.14 TRINITY_DN48904_c0_g1_i1:109-1995(+)
MAAMLEDRLRELDANGTLPRGSLDDHAEAMLRNCDPRISLEALSDWERNVTSRRNPSACVVSLLRRLGADGSGPPPQAMGCGAMLGESEMTKDETAHRELEALMQAVEGRLDAHAHNSLQELTVQQALYIVSDLAAQGEAVRNPSAFVMSAIKRLEGSSNRGALRHSPGAHYMDDTIRESIDKLIDDLELDGGARAALCSIVPPAQVEILRDLVQQYTTVRNQSAFVLSRVKSAGGSTSVVDAARGGGDRRGAGHEAEDFRTVPPREVTPPSAQGFSGSMEKLDSLGLDDQAKRSLAELPESSAADIVYQLESKGDKVRNPSAFVVTLARRVSQELPVRRDAGRPEAWDSSARDSERSPRDRSRSRDRRDRGQRDDRNDVGRIADMDDARMKVANLVDGCDLIDQRAKGLLRDLEPSDALNIMQQLISRSATLRNPSAFVSSEFAKVVANGVGPDPTGDDGSLPSGGYGDFVGESEGAAETAEQADEFGGDNQGENGEMPEAGGFGANWAPSGASFGTSAGKGVGSLHVGGAPPSHVPPTVEDGTSDNWISLDLPTWLRSVDNGKGFLLHYEDALLANYDTLEQIVELYVTPSGPQENLRIDPIFFDDLKVEKVGHQRLFEKWFKDRM